MKKKRRSKSKKSPPKRNTKISLKPYENELSTQAEKVRQLALNSGSRNYPPTSAESLDLNENEIRHHAQTSLDASFLHHEATLRQQISDIERLEAQLRDKTDIAELSSIVSDTKTELGKVYAFVQPNLGRLKKYELMLEAALNSFKQIHKRLEPASYPLSIKAHYLILASIGIVEAMANVTFYGEYKGTTTAILIAFSAAFVNVIVSILAGNAIRFVNSILQKTRALGWTALSGWAIFTFFLNKFLAVFRASLSLFDGNEDPILKASSVAFQAEFPFYAGFSTLDIGSWFLFLLGVIVAVIAMIEGYSSDDPYPGYGKLTRQLNEARDFYHAEEQRLREITAAVIVEAINKVKTLEESKMNAMDSLRLTLRLADKTESDLKKDLTSIIYDFNYLIDTYRNVNRSVRTTPAPSYFSSKVILEDQDLILPSELPKKSNKVSDGLPRLRILLKKATENCAEMRRELGQLDRDNEKALDRFFNSLQTNVSDDFDSLAWRKSA